MRTYKDFYKEEYYNRLQKKSWFFYVKLKEKERWRDLLRLSSPSKDQVFLELGCAKGKSAKFLSYKVKKVIGIDFSKTAIKIASEKNYCENITYKVADASDLSFIKPNSIDCVVAFDFVEHIPDFVLKKVLMEAKRVLKSRGRLVIYTPNCTHYAEIIKHAFNLDPTHINVKTMGSLKHFLRASGFRIEEDYFSDSAYPFLRYLDKLFKNFPILGKFFQFRICIRAVK